MKKQIVVIHGGNIHRSYKEYLFALKNKKIDFEKMTQSGWKDILADNLGRSFQIVMPNMPNASNAKYKEWKILFKKIIPHLEKKVVLVGHSLGAIFLVKYLSENKFSKKILATILVSAPYDKDGSANVLGDFRLKKDLSRLWEQSERLIFFHSVDDEVVPFSDLLKYKEVLPEANFKEFKKRGHFLEKTFPEIIREIKRVFG